MSSRLYPGLVSVTFRKLSPSEIVNLCLQAKLEGIEWGGDIHVPAGDLQCAKETRQLTLEHGLNVAAYGSYYRLGTQTSPFESVLETAQALGAPTIRVWAGTVGSEAASGAYWENVLQESQHIADLSATVGISISYEFHPQTLTDTIESTLQLLETINHPNILTLWQPPISNTCADNIQGLVKLLPWLGNVHVFHWFPEYERCPLSQGTEDWATYLSIIASDERERFLMLEFVKDDSIQAFLEDAQTLQSWLSKQ
jgi:sugar phosphate isomerase/epimerase